jgi:hypothetical protein
VDKLGLSFKDTRTLHQKVDNLPARAGPWKEKVLQFPDQSQEQFLVRFRDPLEAVKALLGDPTLAKDIVYKPRHIFAQDEEGKRRVYNEMWSGDWWWSLQVYFPSQ